jgi:hypothetical protein
MAVGCRSTVFSLLLEKIGSVWSGIRHCGTSEASQPDYCKKSEKSEIYRTQIPALNKTKFSNQLKMPSRQTFER